MSGGRGPICAQIDATAHGEYKHGLSGPASVGRRPIFLAAAGLHSLCPSVTGVSPHQMSFAFSARMPAAVFQVLGERSNGSLLYAVCTSSHASKTARALALCQRGWRHSSIGLEVSSKHSLMLLARHTHAPGVNLCRL